MLRKPLVTAVVCGLLAIPYSSWCREKPIHFALTTETVHGGLKSAVVSGPPLPRLGLALSGGGARAAGSIGVLKVLARNNIPVSAVAGTSMGALIGGLFAAGYQPDEIEEIFLSNDWNEIFKDTPGRAFLTQEQKEGGSRHLLEFAVSRGRFLPPSGLTAGQKLATLLTAKTLAASFAARQDFNRLSIPFRAVATDIETGRVVVLDRGLIHEAVRASIAIPLVFHPVEIEGKLLVDGGLANNLPVDVARSMNTDIVIAVDSFVNLEKKENLTSMFDVMNQSLAIEVRRETEKQAARADLSLRPDVTGFTFTDFPRMKDIIRKGEEAAQAALPKIRQLMKPKGPGTAADRKFHITALVIRGNAAVPEETIRYAVATSLPARPASAADIHGALAHVFSLGYFSDITLDLEPQGRDYRAVLTVRENPIVNEITIRGIKAVSQQEILRQLEGQKGQVLNTTRVSAALNTVVESYRKKGYVLVHVDHAGMHAESGTFEIVMNEGRVDAIDTSSDIKTKPSLIRREINTAIGDSLNIETLEKDLHHLYALDYFDSLTVDLAQSRLGGVELTFKIKEKVTDRVRLGLRFDLEDSFTGLTDIVIDNLTGRGFKLYLNTRYGNYADVTLGYYSPVFLRSYFVHRIQAYYRQRDYFIYDNGDKIDEIDVRRIGGDIAFGYQWFRFGDTYLRYRYETDTTRDAVGPAPTRSNVRIGSLAFLTTIDTRDSNTFPHAGILFTGLYESADPSYGSTNEFVKLAAYLQGNVPLGKRHTVMLEGTIGIGSGEIPYQEQYGIGGADYLLGFPLLGFQRREFTGSNLLGFTLAYRWKIMEYQLAVIKALYINIAGQAANVWDTRDAMSTRDLRTGAGIGLHADTLIGPVRFDAAAGEDDHHAVYFSAGFDF